MMGLIDPPGFRRNRHGQIWLHLPVEERELLADLLAQLDVLLRADADSTPSDPLAELVGIDDSARRPTDPALARLFPDAYDDLEMADEFRRFTQRDLRSLKVANIAAAAASLERPDPTRLTQEEALAWLAALNDLRLTLGTRLGITEEGSEVYLALAPDDPVRATYLVYDWLTYHQDRLVRALDR